MRNPWGSADFLGEYQDGKDDGVFVMTKEEFLGYLKGNSMKYMIRYKHKGNPTEDLEKATDLQRLRLAVVVDRPR